MPSVVVTLCHPSMNNQRSVPLKHGRRVMRISNTFAALNECHSAVKDSDLQDLEKFVVQQVKWCHNCELGQAKTIWLDPTNPSSTQRDAKHASKEGRLDLCGDRHWSDIHKCRALPTGDGWYRARSGKSSGSHFHLLRRVVWSWPHVGAVCRCTKHVLEGVSALNMDSYGLNYIVAHDYVVAPTRTYVSLARVIPCCSLCFQV